MSKSAMTMKSETIGSSFDDFLKKDGIYEGVTARASDQACPGAATC